MKQALEMWESHNLFFRAFYHTCSKDAVSQNAITIQIDCTKKWKTMRTVMFPSPLNTMQMSLALRMAAADLHR